MSIILRISVIFSWIKTWTFAQNVGIGMPFPTERLHVSGNLRLEGAFMPGNNPGTSGQLLFSQAAGIPPIWQTPAGWTCWAADSWNPNSMTSLGWTCFNCGGADPWLTDCTPDLRMLGGYNICGVNCYFEKIFSGLPDHTEVLIEISYFSVDSWDQNITDGTDYVSISVDGLECSRCYPAAPYGDPGAQRTTNLSMCGVDVWMDFGPFECITYAAHTANTLTLRIQSGLNQPANNESLGIASIKLYLR